MSAVLTDAGKEELALALLLWKDFKCAGEFNIEIASMAFRFAKELGVAEQYDKMLSKLPPMRIEPR